MAKRLCVFAAFFVMTLVIGSQQARGSELASTGGQSEPDFVEITAASATPNPCQAGDTVTFTGSVSGPVTGASLDFGDGSPLWYETRAVKSDATTHVYSAPGVYRAIFTVEGDFNWDFVYVDIIVGSGSVINPISGMTLTATGSSASRSAGGASSRAAGTVSLGVGLSRAAGASDASTDIDGLNGRISTQKGIAISQAFTSPGIYVATSTALDSAGASKTDTKVRKMLAMSGQDTGVAGSLPAPSSSVITTKKLTGKMSFTGAKADTLAFSGVVTLPAGFELSAFSGGVPITIGIGNIVDAASVNAKGKGVLPSTKGFITKLKVKFPKLSGPATGVETAQVDVTLSLMNMSDAGMDTEGIASSRRSDETGLKQLSRSLQVDMVLAGAAYETLAPVWLKHSKDTESGALNTRR